MELTIYNVYVEMQDQAQCNQMKQLCINNGLPIGNMFDTDFTFECVYKYFVISRSGNFYIGRDYNIKDKTKLTEAEFIELLQKHKK